MLKVNGTLMQYFHWYYPNDCSLWNKVKDEVAELSQSGITALWLPPSYKGVSGRNGVGYGVYDLYDLGEFDQKGSIKTKYGSKDQYLKAIEVAHENNIQIYADVVVNHKGGADFTERVPAKRCHWNNRNIEYGDTTMIDAWTKFTFPGRGNKYSDFKWNWHHFDGVDWAENLKEKSIFKILGENRHWDPLVDMENGNYDYLMYADIDFQHEDVKAELKKWGEWFVKFTNIDGFRIDAVKHIKFRYFKEWLDSIRQTTGKEIFAVGEYWNPNDVEASLYYLEQSGERMSLFDAPLHKKFHLASVQGKSFDMRSIFSGTLISRRPDLTVSLVENHDTQPLQALEAPVDWWFKPLAYALILLRQEGYPCVFYPDYYGATYRDRGKDGNEYDIVIAKVPKLVELLLARKIYAYGLQRDYFDHNNIVGWTREGNIEHELSGVAVLLSNGDSGSKWMEIGKNKKGKVFYDYLGNRSDTVMINSDGWGDFKVNGGSVSAWVQI